MNDGTEGAGGADGGPKPASKAASGPLVRVLATPAEANASGDVFGGWVMAQMDIAGGMAACGYSHGRTTTAAVRDLRFIGPMRVGDVLSVDARVERAGNTSMTIAVVARSESRTAPEQPATPVAEGTFIFVALDDAGRKRPIIAPA